MPRASQNMNSSKLVEPKDTDSVLDDVRLALAKAGLPDADAVWFSNFLFSPGLFNLVNVSAKAETFLAHINICYLAHIHQHRENRDLQLGALLLELVGLGSRSDMLSPSEPARFRGGQWAPPATDHEGVFPTWVKRYLDESRLDIPSVLKLLKPDSDSHKEFIYHVLLPRLPLHQLIQWDKLPVKKRQHCSNRDIQDFGLLEFWLLLELEMKDAQAEPCSGESVVLPKMVPVFAALPAHQLPDAAVGVLHAIELILSFAHRNQFGDGYKWFAKSLAPFYRVTEVLNPAASTDAKLRHAWRYLATRAFGPEFGGYSEGLTTIQSAELLKCARADLGGLRTILRDCPETCDWEFAEMALQTILSFGKTWDALALLLQAFRVLKKPAVTSDLRYWNEPNNPENVEYPLVRIPMWIATSLYQQRLKTERAQDPQLLDLREAFATFCLKRLKTKDEAKAKLEPAALFKNEDFIEPSAVWRQCYAKAIRELRVNPRGKSHHPLYWSSQHDPDEQVRACSKAAYISVRHETALADTMSPRRPLMAAFWWLRQAHRIELGLTVDPDGAQRTRTKELRRIIETD